MRPTSSVTRLLSAGNVLFLLPLSGVMKPQVQQPFSPLCLVSEVAAKFHQLFQYPCTQILWKPNFQMLLLFKTDLSLCCLLDQELAHDDEEKGC